MVRNGLPIPHEPLETPYGVRKRFRFFFHTVQDQLQHKSPLRIVELGCGTGEGLLIPLAQNLGEKAHLLGIDIDQQSIKHAQKRAQELGLSNITFKCLSVDESRKKLAPESYDLVTVSEVLEHIPNPEALLQLGFHLLRPDGTLFCTIPNGYGPFEWESFLWKLFRMDSFISLVKKSLRYREKKMQETDAMTFNENSGHIGFYSWKNVKAMLHWAGFEIETVKNTEWFCGPFSDRIYTLLQKFGAESRLVAFSQKTGDYLPRPLVSDWMIRARKRKPSDGAAYPTMPAGLFERWWWAFKRKQNVKGN